MKKSGRSPVQPNTANNRTPRSQQNPSSRNTAGKQARRPVYAGKKPNSRQTVWLVVCLILVLAVAVVWLSGLLPLNRGQDPTTDPSQATPSPGITTTSANTTTTQTTTQTSATPTPEPTPTVPPVLSGPQRQAALDAAAKQVMDRLEQVTTGRFGLYFQNLHGGETWSYHDEDPFVAASSIKLAINTCLYTRIAAGDISPDELLSYDSRAYPTGDFEAGTGTIQNLPNGSELTVRETSRLSITISDNCGTNMIIRKLGGIDAINPWLNEISGVVDYRVKIAYRDYAGNSQYGRHRTCARDLGLQAVRLYALWQEQPEVYGPLMTDLSQTVFDFGIQKGIPDSVQVAHKIGTNGVYSAENDVGIVLTEEPFVLCVMTEMADPAQARQVQAAVAAIFYDTVSGWPWT